MSTTVITPEKNKDTDQGIQSYIHILDENDDTFSICISDNNSQIKEYGKYSKYRDALKKAREIQKKRRFLIISQDAFGNVTKSYPAKLNAISSGENAKNNKLRRPHKLKKISI